MYGSRPRGTLTSNPFISHRYYLPTGLTPTLQNLSSYRTDAIIHYTIQASHHQGKDSQPYHCHHPKLDTFSISSLASLAAPTIISTSLNKIRAHMLRGPDTPPHSITALKSAIPNHTTIQIRATELAIPHNRVSEITAHVFTARDPEVRAIAAEELTVDDFGPRQQIPVFEGLVFKRWVATGCFLGTGWG